MIHNTIDLGIIGPLITFSIGMVLFILIPTLASNTKYRDNVMDTYLGICFNSIGHAILDETKVGEYQLHSGSLTDYGLFKITRDDTAYFFDDNANLMKPFYGGYLGLTTTRHEVPCLTTPRLMELSEEEHAKAQRDNLVSIESEKEREDVLGRDMVRTKDRSWESNTTIHVSKTNGLVDPGYVKGVLRHNLPPFKITVVESFVKESQSLLKNVGMWEKVNAILSFVISFGAVVFGYDIIASSGGGGGANLPAIPGMLIGVVPL
jgi:hypothetical protein